VPHFQSADGTDLYYRIDDFSDPWSPSDTVVFLHGLAESGDAWRAWVPHFARTMRVVRPDVRGFGKSAPLTAQSDWSLTALVGDLAQLAATLEVPRFHLVGAKFGGTLAMAFAAQHPQMVASLSIVSAPASLQESLGPVLPGWTVMVRECGVRDWAASTMGPRLGSRMPAAAVHWWTDMMGRTAQSTMLKVFESLAQVNVMHVLHDIQCPTLVMTTTHSRLGSVDAVGSWQRLIPGSRLAVIDSDSYHLAASQPDECAAMVVEFLRNAAIERGARKSG
jgi:pimeloyl-ACP methyl ester carboxylesterase